MEARNEMSLDKQTLLPCPFCESQQICRLHTSRPKPPEHAALLFARTDFASEDEWLRAHEFYQKGWADGMAQASAPVPTSAAVEARVDAFQEAAEECDKVHASRHMQGADNTEAAGAQACAGAIRTLLRKARSLSTPPAADGKLEALARAKSQVEHLQKNGEDKIAAWFIDGLEHVLIELDAALAQPASGGGE